MLYSAFKLTRNSCLLIGPCSYSYLIRIIFLMRFYLSWDSFGSLSPSSLKNFYSSLILLLMSDTFSWSPTSFIHLILPSQDLSKILIFSISSLRSKRINVDLATIYLYYWAVKSFLDLIFLTACQKHSAHSVK